MILGNAIADVDLDEFEKVGSFHEGVIAVPIIDVSLTVKGMRATRLDGIEDCQNTLSLAFELPYDDAAAAVQLIEDPFAAGIIYRRENRDFVELRYKHQLGALTLYAYFLVDVNDCLFGHQDEEDDETHLCTEYASLWKEGFVRKVT